MAPKNSSSGARIVEISIYVDTSTFNDDNKSILLMMKLMHRQIGHCCYEL